MAKNRTGKYVLVWIALVALTLVSFLISLAGLGAFETAIALGIAVTKSTLVLLFFMHLLEHRATSALVPVVTASMLGLLLALTFADVVTRHTSPPAASPSIHAR